ncbi:MAG TPA: hypothetical protein VFR07_19215 [Mycobacteriales bacterium]|jgi:plasmid stabilization system protein ParE|nr:hypothetical protein [Mycobacteriales bacterium]
MTTPTQVRRHLYEQYAGTPLRALRARRRLRRQIALLGPPPGAGPGGAAGVREPRRPLPPHDRPGTTLLP